MPSVCDVGNRRTEFQKILIKQGLKFRLNTKVTGVTKSGTGHSVTIEPSKGGAAEKVSEALGGSCHSSDP